jgi:hypothetical protein
MWVAKLMSKATIPKFVTGAKIFDDNLSLEGSEALRLAMREAVGIDEHVNVDNNGYTCAEKLGSTKGDHHDHGHYGCREAAKKARSSETRNLNGEWVMHKSVQPKPVKDSTVVFYLHGG